MSTYFSALHSWLHYSQQSCLTLLKLGSEPIDYCNHHQYPIGNESYQHTSVKMKKKCLGFWKIKEDAMFRCEPTLLMHDIWIIYSLSTVTMNLLNKIANLHNINFYFLLWYHAAVDWSIDLKLMCRCQSLEISVAKVPSCVKSNRVVHSWHFWYIFHSFLHHFPSHFVSFFSKLKLRMNKKWIKNEWKMEP